MLRRFVRRADGQDLIEFALLGTAISSMLYLVLVSGVPDQNVLGDLTTAIRYSAVRVTDTVREAVSTSIDDALRVTSRPGSNEQMQATRHQPSPADESK